MRIIIIATEFAPFKKNSSTKDNLDVFAATLVKKGNDVHIIFPMSKDTAISGNSLARRLTPIKVVANNKELEFGRLEGRTTTGVHVYILDLDQRDTFNEQTEADIINEGFYKAAAQFCGTLANEQARLIVWRADKLATNATLPKNIKNIAIITHHADNAENMHKFDNVIVSGKLLFSHLTSGKNAPLAQMAKAGKVIGLPHAPQVEESRQHPPLSFADKASAKASFQSLLGLPVRLDVPVFLFQNQITKQLHKLIARFLCSDVQIIIMGASQNHHLKELSDKYPDRLAVVFSSISPDAALAAADFCFSLEHPRNTVFAMSYGAVPVVTTQSAEGVVALEPSLNSGSGFILADLSEQSIKHAFGEANAAFSRTAQFRELCSRIQKYTTSWSTLTDTIISIIQ